MSEPVIYDTSLGFLEWGSDKFMPLDLIRPDGTELLHCQKSLKWSEFATKIRRQEQLQSLRSSIRRITNDLPENIEKIYLECERVCSFKINSETKKLKFVLNKSDSIQTLKTLIQRRFGIYERNNTRELKEKYEKEHFCKQGSN